LGRDNGNLAANKIVIIIFREVLLKLFSIIGTKYKLKESAMSWLLLFSFPLICNSYRV
jgi:hypothetical protein